MRDRETEQDWLEEYARIAGVTVEEIRKDFGEYEVRLQRLLKELAAGGNKVAQVLLNDWDSNLVRSKLPGSSH